MVANISCKHTVIIIFFTVFTNIQTAGTTYSQVRKVKQTASTKHKNIIYMNSINKLSLTGLYWSGPVRFSLG